METVASNQPAYKIAVVIPCFKVRHFITDVIASIPPSIEKIFIVDDACPEQTGLFVQKTCHDKRVEIIYNPINLGVGGAVIAGYRRAMEDGFLIAVKLDGDGQMDGGQILSFTGPIQQGIADYTKGNRFYYPAALHHMPKLRLFGNAILSFITKFSSGYWDSFDPTNGYTAVSIQALQLIPLEKLNTRYFFESDILFRLNIIRAVVMDIPMEARYNHNQSNLRITNNIGLFLRGNISNFIKRIAYNYYLRNFSLASLQLILGTLLIIFGALYGSIHWLEGIANHQAATAGTVMIAALPIIIGFQLLMSFLNYDINTVPKHPLGRKLQ